MSRAVHDFPFSHKHLCDDELDGCCRQCAQSKEMVKRHLLRFHETILGFTEADFATMTVPELYQLFLVLDDIAHMDIRDELAEEILLDTEVCAALPAIRAYYRRFFDLHETALAHAILAGSDPWAILRRYALFPRYEALVRGQMHMFTGTPVQRMAFIGSGPVPLTLILLEANHHIASVGFDLSPGAVELSRRVLDALDLHRVTVRQGDESLVATGEFDAVLVAALAEPKERILGALAAGHRAAPVPVFLRTYTGMRALLHAPFRPEASGLYRETAKATPPGRVNNTLVRLELP